MTTLPRDSWPHDPAAVRALAAAVLRQAIADATSTPRAGEPAEETWARADACDFLLGDRCERWCAACGIDPDAMRSRLRWRVRDAA